MKWIYYIVFFLLLSIFFTFFVFIQNGIAKEKCGLEQSTYHLHKINMDIPHISDPVLKQAIDNYLNNYKSAFLNSIKDVNIQKDMMYTLDVEFDKYSFSKYDSYVFYLSVFTGGAHPIPSLWTINYDKELKKIITIDDYINKDKNFLNNVSKSVRGDLLLNPNAVNANMIYYGTEPIKENFENFVITKDGLIFFFAPYQVAPYSSGVLMAKYNL